MSVSPYDAKFKFDPGPIRRAELQQLARNFPGSMVWFGHFTREWWAYIPAGPHGFLVGGAGNPQVLDHKIRAALGWVR